MDDDIVSLKYNGKSSAQFGMRLNYPLNLSHTKKDVSSTSVSGVDGDYISDNMRNINVTQQLQFTVDRNPIMYETWEQLEFAVENWLHQGDSYTEYKPFYLDHLNPYHWMAYMSEAPVWTITDPISANCTITLNCKPYLIREDEQFIPVGKTVINKETISARPLWHIVANGAADLKINHVNYHFQNIDGEVFVDTSRFLIYKSLTEPRGTVAQFPNHDFPILPPGANEIEITGDKINNFEFKPNWRRLL